MTQPVRSFPVAEEGRVSWRAVSSPRVANDASHVAARRRAATAKKPLPLGRALPKEPGEVARLLATLDLKQRHDLRAAALLVLMRLGLRKREIVELDVSDVVTIGRLVCLAVKSRVRRAGSGDSFLPVAGANARILARYVASQHDDTAALSDPLFYNVENGRDDRLTRISNNAISYWLFELRLRARAAENL